MSAVKRITVSEATVKTAAVEVKTLTISGKQVTLAVFRQLQEEELLDLETGTMRGLPWGMVNYHWPACPSGHHVHVVWQSGGELRRSTVRPGNAIYDSKRAFALERRAARHSALLAAACALRVAPDPIPHESNKPCTLTFRNLNGLTFTINAVEGEALKHIVSLWVPLHALRTGEHPSYTHMPPERLAAARECWQELAQGGVDLTTSSYYSGWKWPADNNPWVNEMQRRMRETRTHEWWDTKGQKRMTEREESTQLLEDVQSLLSWRREVDNAKATLQAWVREEAEALKVGTLDSTDDLSRLCQTAIDLGRERASLVAQIEARLAEVASLDQLFIAV